MPICLKKVAEFEAVSGRNGVSSKSDKKELLEMPTIFRPLMKDFWTKFKFFIKKIKIWLFPKIKSKTNEVEWL